MYLIYYSAKKNYVEYNLILAKKYLKVYTFTEKILEGYTLNY